MSYSRDQGAGINGGAGTNDDTRYMIPAIKDYADRIGARQRNFRTYAVCVEDRGYSKDVATIKIGNDGTIAVKAKGNGTAYEPTEEERTTIKAAVIAANFPYTIEADAKVKELRAQLSNPGNRAFFIFYKSSTINGDGPCCGFVQHRVKKADGSGKTYVPYSYWSDGSWRKMEPDLPGGLPLWKPRTKRHGRIMCHEGAKAADYCDWMCYSDEPEAKAAAAACPWIDEPRCYDHWGWIGGAHRTHDTNWGEIAHTNLDELTFVADNDVSGQRAVCRIAYELRGLDVVKFAIFFDDEFTSKFDLADPFPEKMWKNGRYIGKRMTDYRVCAAWATEEIDNGKKAKTYKIRPAFLRLWVYAVLPQVFVNRYNPTLLLSEEQFNAEVRPFSHIKNTADLVRREIEANNIKSVAYEPGTSRGIIVVDGLRCINTWTPTRIERRAGDAT
jgi:hypothetical protein